MTLQQILPLTVCFIVSSHSLAAPNATADVNMKDGGFIYTATDATTVIDGRVFQWRRSYNSRSLHSGLLGFGWCTDYEKHLDFRQPEQIVLYDCRLPAEVIFKKKRAKYYQNANNPDDVLEFKNNYYQRSYKNSYQRYSSLGHLASLSDKTGFQLKLFYDHAHSLEKISFNGLQELKIKFDPGRKRIASITLPNEVSVSYKYSKSDLTIVSVAAASTPSTNAKILPSSARYLYDDQHNLIQVRQSRKDFEIIDYDIKYDTEKDFVQLVLDREGCRRKLNFVSRSPAQYSATSELQCPGSSLKRATYQFYYRTTSDGRTYLEKMLRSRDEKSNLTKPEKVSFKLQGGMNDDP